MSENNTLSKWTKISAIGSLLAGIAILFVAYQIIQTNQTIELQKRALTDTENEQSQHLRPWLGVSDTEEGIRVVKLPNGNYLTRDDFDKMPQQNRIMLNPSTVMWYEIKVTNFGSTPAENVTHQFYWTYNTKPSKVNLISASNITNRLFLLPNDKLSDDLPLKYTAYQSVANGTEQWLYYIIRIDYDFKGGNHGYYQQIGHITPTGEFDELDVTGG